MPIYAFHCDSCEQDFERLQKLSDPDPTTCPACSAPQVRRLLSAPQFRLAGAGWYETDFKKDGDKKRNLADTGNPSGSDAPAPAPANANANANGSANAKPEPQAGRVTKPASAETH